VGWDKKSLTDQQREKKVTAIILLKRIYGMQFSHHSVLRLVLRSKSPSFRQIPT